MKKIKEVIAEALEGNINHEKLWSDFDELINNDDNSAEDITNTLCKHHNITVDQLDKSLTARQKMQQAGSKASSILNHPRWSNY